MLGGAARASALGASADAGAAASGRPALASPRSSCWRRCRGAAAAGDVGGPACCGFGCRCRAAWRSVSHRGATASGTTGRAGCLRRCDGRSAAAGAAESRRRRRLERRADRVRRPKAAAAAASRPAAAEASVARPASWRVGRRSRSRRQFLRCSPEPASGPGVVRRRRRRPPPTPRRPARRRRRRCSSPVSSRRRLPHAPAAGADLALRGAPRLPARHGELRWRAARARATRSRSRHASPARRCSARRATAASTPPASRRSASSTSGRGASRAGRQLPARRRRDHFSGPADRMAAAAPAARTA